MANCLENEEIKLLKKPNEYSTWDKENNKWIEDKAKKLKYLENQISKTTKFVKYKKSWKKKKGKNKFESLAFDVTETEERIIEIKAEMDLIKTEIAKLTKDIKS